MTLVVRRVGADAATSVHAVVRAAFAARPVLDPPADALGETPDTIAAALSAGGGLLATLEGRPVGALLMASEGHTVWLRRFGVVADFFPTFGTLEKFETVHAMSSVPTAIICGTRDKLTPIEHSRKLHSMIEGSTLLECDGAGHMVMLERHDQVNAELDQLLASAGDLVDQR